MSAHDFIDRQIKIIDVIDLLEYDHDVGQLYEKLKVSKKDHYAPDEKIIVLHNDTEYFYQGHKLGFTLYNLLTCWRDLDIPYHVLVIYTNHSDLESAVASFIVHPDDRPIIISTIVNNNSWYVLSKIPEFTIRKNISHSAFCLIGKERQHRNKFFQYLTKNDLFDHVKVNYQSHFHRQAFNPDNDRHRPNLIYITDKISNSIYTFPHRINETCFSQSKYHEIVELSSVKTHARQDLEGEVNDFYNDFFLEIVLETVFDYPHVFVSEKILKPLMFKTPFVVFGPMGTLNHLQKHGFKTFDEFWDERYDLEVDPHLRFLECCKLMHSIVTKPISELQGLYQLMKSILDHNQSRLLEYIETEYKPLYNKINL